MILILERHKGYLMLDTLLALMVICYMTTNCQMLIVNLKQNKQRLMQEQIQLVQQLQTQREQWEDYAK